jgi:HK97 family phage portal protein
MKIFGWEIRFTGSRSKSGVPATTVPAGWDPNFGSPFWNNNSGSFPIVQEPSTGAWQRNQDIRGGTLLSFYALYRCVMLIRQSISLMRIKLVEQLEGQTYTWREVERNSPYWQVLIKPNRYQNRIQFFDEWIGSKITQGNTYVLKQRDSRGIVVAMYVLNPYRVRPLVAPDGSVWYELGHDYLHQIDEDKVRVPASEIIHDRYSPLYHPLIGISPIAACALSGALGLAIQGNSARFFQNSSRPGGILTAPDRIEDDTANRLKKHWEDNYTGANAGKIAVLGDGLKFEALRETATDAQLIEQLKLSGENVCTAFGVPPFMIGIGAMPAYNNIEALTQQFYSQCLQVLIESVEILLDEGLGLTVVPGKSYGTEFNLDDLLRMDTATKSTTWVNLVKGGIAAPNEGRAVFDLKPLPGGDSVFMQEQNYSLEALAKRDAKADPFASAKPQGTPDPKPNPSPKPGQPAPSDNPPSAEDNQNASIVPAHLAANVLRIGKYFCAPAAPNS